MTKKLWSPLPELLVCNKYQKISGDWSRSNWFRVRFQCGKGLVLKLRLSNTQTKSMVQWMLKPVQKFQQILSKQGFNFVMEAKVTDAEIRTDGVTLKYEMLKTGEKASVDADVVLVATGRRPFSEGLGLEEVGVVKDPRGCVTLNETLANQHCHNFAIGDLIAGQMLAHKAEEEGVAVAEFIANRYGHVNYELSLVWSTPGRDC